VRPNEVTSALGVKSVGMHCKAMLFFINKGINTVDANNHYSLFTIHYSLYQEVPHVH
jgi:hypothetical protein